MLRKAWVLVVLSFGVALVAPSAASAACNLSGVSASPIKVYRVSAPPFEYRVEGWAHVNNPGTKVGCHMKVCEAEELGAGNWVPAWCNTWRIAAGQYNFHSQAPYIDCQNYGGTGWFRSYVRMENGGVKLLGPPRYVCT